MTSTSLNHRRALVFAAAAILLAGPALAREGDPRHLDEADRMSTGTAHGRHSPLQVQHRHFEERHRHIVREYYQRESHAGRYPPGWERRDDRRWDHWKYRDHGHVNQHGHFKPWRMGYPLHYQVVYYEVPVQVLRRLGPPPRGHRYVQVAGDILLIAIGSALVVDALEDLINWR
jgi:Ni/Co efflux regulator RcnB